jgi:hypothetical protein
MYIGYISTSDQIIYGKNKSRHNIYKAHLFNNSPCLVSYGGKLKGKILIILNIDKTYNNLPLGNIINVIGLMNDSNLYITLQYIYNIFRKNISYKPIINQYELNLNRIFINETIFSIDPHNSLDIDDAISYNGIDTVNIYIAQPIYYLTEELLINRSKVAFSTLYYNEINNLWGDEITKLSSLLVNEKCPAYCISFKFIDNDIIINSYPCFIINKIQTNYDECLNYPIINDFYNFTKKITNINDTHELISYWMILVNNYIGNNFKVPHRVIKDNKINNFNDIDEDVKNIFINYLSDKAKYSFDDNYHCKLDKYNYTHFTSPIRRMIDTIIHWCITYNINIIDLLNKYNITIDEINILDKNTKKFHNDINLLNKINNLNQENDFYGWVYSIKNNIWNIYFKELGFQKVKMWANKLDDIIDKTKFENIKIGDKLKFKVFIKNGFLVRDKILIVLL